MVLGRRRGLQVGLPLSRESLLVRALGRRQSLGHHRIVRRQDRSERVRRGNRGGWGPFETRRRREEGLSEEGGAGTRTAAEGWHRRSLAAGRPQQQAKERLGARRAKGMEWRGRGGGAEQRGGWVQKRAAGSKSGSRRRRDKDRRRERRVGRERVGRIRGGGAKPRRGERRGGRVGNNGQ
jgi:hypothetical protein